MLSFRAITDQDIEIVCSHRERMFLEAGHPQDRITLMTENYLPWMKAKILEGIYFGRAAILNESIVGSIGWMTIPWPPHPMHPDQDERGYVLNLFVEPDHRRKGIAKLLMDYVDSSFRDRGIEYCILHSTSVAQTMYQKLGWKGTSEMSRKYI